MAILHTTPNLTSPMKQPPPDPIPIDPPREHLQAKQCNVRSDIFLHLPDPSQFRRFDHHGMNQVYLVASSLSGAEWGEGCCLAIGWRLVPPTNSSAGCTWLMYHSLHRVDTIEKLSLFPVTLKLHDVKTCTFARNFLSLAENHSGSNVVIIQVWTVRAFSFSSMTPFCLLGFSDCFYHYKTDSCIYWCVTFSINVADVAPVKLKEDSLVSDLQ